MPKHRVPVGERSSFLWPAKLRGFGIEVDAVARLGIDVEPRWVLLSIGPFVATERPGAVVEEQFQEFACMDRFFHPSSSEALQLRVASPSGRGNFATGCCTNAPNGPPACGTPRNVWTMSITSGTFSTGARISMRNETTLKETKVQLRMRPLQKDVITRAAELKQTTVTNFMVEQAFCIRNSSAPPWT